MGGAPGAGRVARGPLRGHDHRHGHGHGHGTLTAILQHRKRLVAVMIITATVFVAEVVGGTLSGSLALLADAGHLARGRSGEILDSLGTCLGEHSDVAHCTFPLEPEGHREHEPVQHA